MRRLLTRVGDPDARAFAQAPARHREARLAETEHEDVEAVSVMLQVAYFKYTKYRYGTGKRILLMAPLHHHFEESGWKETQVVVRFWIITMMLVLVGLSTLKLR